MSYPDAWGLKYEEVQSLSRLAYKAHGKYGRYRFPNAGSVWEVVDIHERGSFRAVLVRGRKTIVALSGTDDLGDWVDNIGQGVRGVSVQYLRAVRYANSTAPDVVVGHSLGGGMASYVAVYTGRRAATINPAPLNLNIVSRVAIFKNGNQVINYVAPGEALAILDAGARNMRKVGTTHRVASHGGFNPIARHLLDNLDGFVEPKKI